MASLVSAPAAISSGWNLSSIRNALPSIGSRQVRFNYQFSSKSNFGLRLNPGRMEAPKCFTSSFGGMDSLISSFSGQFAPMRIVRRLKIYAMKHGRKVAKLNRPPDQRKALVRGLVTQLLRHGRIKTTFARAKAIRKFTDRMITLAKDGSQHKRRQACGFVYDKLLVHAMFMEAPKRYADRNGGYTSVCRTDNRRGDNAPMAYISLV